MVGLVLVSHSRALAAALRELVASMGSPQLPIAIAAGAGPDHADFGTDATEILDAIQAVMSEDGVLVVLDIGSAILSAETAVEFLDEAQRTKVRLCSAPFVEGAVVAGVLSAAGSDLEKVREEAERALRHKAEHFEVPVDQNASVPAARVAEDDAVTTTVVVVRNRHGLHARPTAELIREAARHRCEIFVRNRSNGKGPASARSMSELVSIEILQDHEIELSARGLDAENALIALRAEIEAGLGETLQSSEVSESATGPRCSDSDSPRSNPVPVSGGIAIGPLLFAETGDAEVPSHKVSDTRVEKERLRKAIASAKAAIAQDAVLLRRSLGKDEAEIFRAQSLVIDDPALIQTAEKAIQEDLENAALAWQRSYQAAADIYEHLSDDYLQQRAADVRDIGHRVLEALGIRRRKIPILSEPAILVAEDLTPADVADLPGEFLLGVICMQGGKTSHAAILLRARGIPAIAKAKPFFEHASVSSAVVDITGAFDGDSGELWLNPSQEQLQELRVRKKSLEGEIERITRLSHERAITRDGYTIDILANLGSAAEAAEALKHGAEGVGLFRTEYLFLNRNDVPEEKEQFEALRTVRDVMDQRPVVIRTLDIGGDKVAPGLGLPREENPFLGVRAIRLCLKRRELFRTHLRAILRAAYGGNFRVMFPMIADPQELREAMTELAEVHVMLERENKTHAWPVPVGIMIEVPSAAILVDQLAPMVDFISIGTNDLTQYVLATDRNHSELPQFQDGLHPAVLRLISRVTAAAHTHGTQVGVCGEAASDSTAAGVLVGLGVDELSLAPALIPKIKQTVRAISRKKMEMLAADAQGLGAAAEVRALAGAQP